METSRENPKEIQEISNNVTNEDCIDGLIRRVNMAKERICKFKNMVIESSQTKIHREKE